MTCPNQECKGEGKILMSVPDGDGGLRWVEEKCLTCKGKGYVVDEIWKQGFTLIELIGVIAVISLVALAVIPATIRTKVVVNYGTTPHTHYIVGDNHRHLVEHVHDSNKDTYIHGKKFFDNHTHGFVHVDHTHKHDDIDHDHDFETVTIIDDPDDLNEFLNPKVR